MIDIVHLTVEDHCIAVTSNTLYLLDAGEHDEGTTSRDSEGITRMS